MSNSYKEGKKLWWKTASNGKSGWEDEEEREGSGGVVEWWSSVVVEWWSGVVVEWCRGGVVSWWGGVEWMGAEAVEWLSYDHIKRWEF